jgi:hypothetical protein
MPCPSSCTCRRGSSAAMRSLMTSYLSCEEEEEDVCH